MSTNRDLLTAALEALTGGSNSGMSSVDVAKHLLPVVERIANERAAAELRKAVGWIWDDVPALASASAELHARADHLDPS